MARRQGSFFETADFAFDKGFLHDYAGQVITEPRIAIIELIANSYDAGAALVHLDWPEEVGGRISVTDDGTGLTREEFERRWKTLSYNRIVHQGPLAEFPPGTPKTRRPAFGRSGKGRLAPFCFADEYSVETWKGGQLTKANVKLADVGSVPFRCLVEAGVAKGGHGTRVSTIVTRHLLPTEDVLELIGSKFAVDPSFRILLNERPIELLNLRNIRSSELAVEPHGTLRILEIDTQTSDRTARLRGITWWVNGRMVGEPTWEDLDGDGAYLDGRTNEARRFSFIVEANMLHDQVKHDWTGFYASRQVNDIRQAVHRHVVQRLQQLLAGTRRNQKREALKRSSHLLRDLPTTSRKSVGAFVDAVVETCPTISERDLSRTAEVFAKMEQSRSGYELLAKLAACSPRDIDTWNELMGQWTATSAEIVLNELHRRLRLIERLQQLVGASGVDELHDLQPLFERGLWMFGPEFEAVDFRSNRSLAEVVGRFLGGGNTDNPRRRPDFVVLPDGTLGVYSADAYDEQNEVSGIRRVLIVELKRSGFRLTQKEVDQARDYAKEVRRGGRVRPEARIEGYVLGAVFDEGLEPLSHGDQIKITPMTFDTLLNRAHARTFHLQRRLREAEPQVEPDEDVEAVLAPGEQREMFGESEDSGR